MRCSFILDQKRCWLNCVTGFRSCGEGSNQEVSEHLHAVPATPSVPKMADFPSACRRLCKTPFYSSGVDCFGPFPVKIRRPTEKRWCILYKCLHLDLLESLDANAFLMSRRRFIAKRGKLFELLSDKLHLGSQGADHVLL